MFEVLNLGEVSRGSLGSLVQPGSKSDSRLTRVAKQGAVPACLVLSAPSFLPTRQTGLGSKDSSVLSQKANE